MRDLDHVEPIVEVLRNSLSCDRLPEVLGCRDNAGVDAHLFRPRPAGRSCSFLEIVRSRSPWSLGELSPISSRKMVPPSAFSNLPFFWRLRR